MERPDQDSEEVIPDNGYNNGEAIAKLSLVLKRQHNYLLSLKFLQTFNNCVLSDNEDQVLKLTTTPQS